MAFYTAHNRMAGTQQNLSTSFKTILNIVGATTFRARLWAATFGADNLPNATDCAIDWDIATKDATTAGTASSAVTPAKVNPADRAAALTVNGNYTAEPTTFTSSYNSGLNQRNSQRWTAYGPDQALVLPATLNLGLGIRALSTTYALTVVAAFEYEEV